MKRVARHQLVLAGATLSLGVVTVFGDVLNLERAVTIALADNPSIQAAGARVEQAKARLDQADARRYPTLNGLASVTRRDLAESQLSPMDAMQNPTEVYAAQVQAQWVLFDGFSRRHAILAAEYARDGSEESLEDSRRQLITAVARAFHSAQLSRENIAIAEADEAFNRRQLDEAKARQKAGTGSLSDALNFEVRANAARSSVIRARRSYEIAMSALAALMAISDAAFPETTTLSPLGAETDTEMRSPLGSNLVARALLQRPDMRAADQSEKRAKAQAASQRGENWPTIALQGSANGEREDDFGFESDDFGTRVGGTLTYTFSDGGARRGRVREFEAAALEAERNRDDLALRIAGEVREAVAEVRREQEQLVLQVFNGTIEDKLEH